MNVWRGCLCWVFALVSFLTGAALYAQAPGNVMLESSEQVFCVLAALNAGGYDTGLGASTGDYTRAEARDYLNRINAPIAKELAKFYAEHRVESDPGADLGQYISLALLIGPPPDFNFTVPEFSLPPDAKAVAGLIPLLRAFYRQGGLYELWAKLQKRYQAAELRYSGDVRQAILLTDAYFRFPTGGYMGRTYRIDLDLLGSPEQVQARIYGMNYYLVATPSRQAKIDQIRHQYLHFLLDPLAAKYVMEIQSKASLRSTAYHAPALATSFKEDFSLLVTECLIRAAELRLDNRPPQEAEKSLDEMMASGLILARYFYESLLAFEKQEASMTAYYQQMMLDIKPNVEQLRLSKVKFTSAPAPAAPTPVSVAKSEEERLLDDGDNLFFKGRYGEAKLAYRQVIDKFNPKSERALFGLAVVASNTRKPDLAEEYFKKTLDVARDLRLVTWSHIYLGRLSDLRGNRKDALVQYQAASLTATAYPEALRAVQSGMAQQFGSKDEKDN